MQEIMDDILAVEGEAEKIIKQAREKASQLKNSVENEMNEYLQRAKEDAKKLIHDETEQAKSEAEKEYNEAIKRAEEENRIFLEENSDKVGRIVEDIVKIIITPEYNRE